MLALLASRRLRYLLTALLRIAASAKPVSGKALASMLQCPARYLEPDLQALVAGGILHSRRGAGGGYSLARAAARISLLDVLSSLDLGASESDKEEVCRLQASVVVPLLEQAGAACLDSLNAWTLDSFLGRAEREGLLRGLELPANFSI